MKTPADLREWVIVAREKRISHLRRELSLALDMMGNPCFSIRYWGAKKYISLSGSTNKSIELAKMRVSNVRSRISLNKEMWS